MLETLTMEPFVFLKYGAAEMHKYVTECMLLAIILWYCSNTCGSSSPEPLWNLASIKLALFTVLTSTSRRPNASIVRSITLCASANCEMSATICSGYLRCDDCRKEALIFYLCIFCFRAIQKRKLVSFGKVVYVEIVSGQTPQVAEGRWGNQSCLKLERCHF